MRRLLVIEANEIPLDVFEWYAAQNPSSTIARILSDGETGQSIVSDAVPREIYPSQTWASLATGMPFEKHQIYWYGDPKPVEFPLYWQRAAEKVSVGIVGVLHSSPFDQQCKAPGLRFAIPDAFAADSETLPSSLAPLQALNLDMTSRNARVTRSLLPPARHLRVAKTLARHRLSLKAMAKLGAMGVSLLRGSIPRERARTAQFILLGDLFTSLSKKHDPDLAVVFTNHVAAAMHRYWYASFPQDWENEVYDDVWVSKYKDEILAALDALDNTMTELLAWCKETDRTMLIITSMGQHGGDEVSTDLDYALVVQDGSKFLQVLGVSGAADVRQNMVPHLTVEFRTDEEASAAERQLNEVEVDGPGLTVDRNAKTITVTYHLASNQDGILIDGEHIRFKSAGLEAIEIEDHRCGTHQPLGTILVANSPTAALGDTPVDYLEIAPAILNSLGVEPMPLHKDLTIAF